MPNKPKQGHFHRHSSPKTFVIRSAIISLTRDFYGHTRDFAILGVVFKELNIIHENLLCQNRKIFCDEEVRQLSKDGSKL